MVNLDWQDEFLVKNKYHVGDIFITPKKDDIFMVIDFKRRSHNVDYILKKSKDRTIITLTQQFLDAMIHTRETLLQKAKI